MRHGGAVLAILTLGAWFPTAVHAQPAPPAGGRMEVSVGGARSGTISFAGPDALEEDREGNPYILFTADSELRPAAGYGARVALRLGGRLHVETGISYSKPELLVRVGSDAEDAEAISITETISQLHVEAGIVVELTPPRPERRNVPFVTAGAGYLRELHEGQTLVVDGRSYFLGGGVKRFLTIRPGWVKAVGVRADGRIAIRSKGVAFDDRVSLAPAFGGSLFVRF